MSSEEKVKRVYEVMEKAKKDLEEARKQVMDLYSEIKSDPSVYTPELCGIVVDHS